VQAATGLGHALLGSLPEIFGGARGIAFDAAAVEIERPDVELPEHMALFGRKLEPFRGFADALRDTLRTPCSCRSRACVMKTT
jgi:hypothetical protein